MSARVLAIVLKGQEAASLASLPALVAVARAESARVRLAYVHPFPRPRLDSAGRVRVEEAGEMARITRTIVEGFSAAARRFDDVVIGVVVRFGGLRKEVSTEIEVVRPAVVVCLAPRTFNPRERLRAWGVWRQLTGVRRVVLETEARPRSLAFVEPRSQPFGARRQSGDAISSIMGC